jgi:starvation-inducible DNA-binding protein
MSKNKDVVKALTKTLADSFVLYFKTHSFHWNVTGPQFKALHEMFEEQYTDIWNATDEIAERIRALGEYAPNNFSELLDITTLTPSGQTPDADGMLEMLAEDNRTISKEMMKTLRVAEEAGDEVTVDLMVERMDAHDQAAWMLESSRSKAA